MNYDNKSCACSGIRSCLLCQQNEANQVELPYYTYWFCPKCWKIYEGDISIALDSNEKHINSNTCSSICSFHDGKQVSDDIKANGIQVFLNFITNEEETYLVNQIERKEWKMSQSGRRKQDYGPQVNFKKKKVKLGSFSGFPTYCKFLLDRMKPVDCLTQFTAVELCNLEYMSERGSSIDPHIDDTWLWGEQLVTINLVSNTILTLKSDMSRDEIQILMPAKSLMILEKDARYVWTHCIKREHVRAKRIAMTFRNMSEGFMREEKQQEIVKKLLECSETFLDIS